VTAAIMKTPSAIYLLYGKPRYKSNKNIGISKTLTIVSLFAVLITRTPL
jgi:hypothetical protein